MTGRRWFGLLLLATLAALGIGLSITAEQTTGTSAPVRTPVSISESPNPSPSTGISSPNPEDSPSPPSLPGSPISDGASPSPSPGSSTPVGNTPCVGELSQADLATDALPEGAAKHTQVAPFGCVTVYKVKPGDTLFDIANDFTIQGAYLTLYDWNASVVGQDPSLIRPGQVIIVDPTGKVTAPAR